MIALAGWVPVVGFLGVAVHLGWLSLPWPLVHDAPIMHYIAWRIGEGAVPYRDLFDMNFPGVYLVHLGVLKLLGAGDAAWRTFDLFWLALTSLTVALFARPWRRVASLGGAAFFAAYHLGAGAWQTGQRDFLLCPFLLAGALGVVHWRERGRAWALGVGALALGAGVTIKPHAMVLAVALALLAFLAPAPARPRWVGPAVLVAGLVIVPLAVVAWIATIGGLGAWRDIVFGYLVPLYSRLRQPGAWSIYRWSLWPALGLALVLSIGHALDARRLTFRHAVALVGLGYGLVHYVGQGKGWEYHLYPLAAFAAVLLCSEVAAVLRARPVAFGVPLLAALAALVVMLEQTGTVNAEAGWIWDKERQVRLLTEDLEAGLRPGDRVQVLDTTDGGVHALLRLGVPEPTRFLYDFHFFHDTGHPVIRALRAELLAGLDAAPPRFIVLFRRGWPRGGAERIDDFPELAERLRDRYRAILRPAYILYAKRDRS